MKKVLLILSFMLLAGMAFAGGADESSIRNDYGERGFMDRADWVYEFNSIAVRVIDETKFILGEKKDFMGTDWHKIQFDETCLKYKVLLDIGVEHGFIDDKTRKEQTDKAMVERNKVSNFLAQQSSGLGL